MDTANNMAQSIGRLNPLTVKLASELLLQSRNTGLDEGLAMESALACLAFASQETKELLYKFLEKRK
jgi:enoyl-CoA hydratase/carnithine racemase